MMLESHIPAAQKPVLLNSEILCSHTTQTKVELALKVLSIKQPGLPKLSREAKVLSLFLTESCHITL
jgi:hypothetical protein